MTRPINEQSDEEKKSLEAHIGKDDTREFHRTIGKDPKTNKTWKYKKGYSAWMANRL